MISAIRLSRLARRTPRIPVPVRGAVLAFEVSDLDVWVARLRKLGTMFRREITETPVGRFAIVLDPDGSEFIIHKRKE